MRADSCVMGWPVRGGLRALAAVSLVLALFGCGGGGGSSGGATPVSSPSTDTVPPSLQQVIPATDSTVGVLSSVSLVFSEPVNGAGASASYVLGGPGAASLSVGSVSAQSQSAYGLTLSGTPADGLITLDLVGISDLAGNALPATRIAYTADLTNPTMVASPPGGSLLTAISTIDLTFSKAVIGADVAGNYGLSGPAVNTLAVASAAVQDAGTNTYRVTLSGTPASGSLTLTATGIDDGVGHALAGNTVAYALDVTAPTANANPASGTISSSQAIVIQFSESMKTDTLVLGGTMYAGGANAVWGTQTFANDKLTVSPGTAWAGGAATLTVKANDLAGNALSQLNLSYTVDTLAPSATTTPAHLGRMTTSTSIVVQFSEATNTRSATLTDWVGTPVAFSGTYNAGNLTYTLTPSGSWPVGELLLAVDATDTNNNAMSTLNVTLGVMGTVTYVSPTGSDSNPGTLHLPVQSLYVGTYLIPAAFAGVTEVRVGAGTYTTGFPIMRGNLKVLGGYNSTFTTRDATVNLTTVAGQAFNGSLYKQGVVYVGPGIASGEVSGFRILAEAGGSRTGVYLDGQDQFVAGTGFVIQNNDFRTQLAVSDVVIGIGQFGRSSGSSIHIQNNVFSGRVTHGIYVNGSYGVSNYSPTVTVTGNTMSLAPTYFQAMGVHLEHGQIAMDRNRVKVTAPNEGSGVDILAFAGDTVYMTNNILDITGTGTSGIGVNLRQNAATVSVSLDVSNNTILTNSNVTTGFASSVVINATAGVLVRGNILYAKASGVTNCIDRATSGSVPISVLVNDFGCGNKYYDVPANTIHSTIGTMETSITNAGKSASGNVDYNPNFTNFAGGDFHFTTSSPCTVTHGSINLFNSTDFAGSARPGSDIYYSMGAYEYDGTCSATNTTWTP